MCVYRFNSGCLRSFARNPSFDRFHPVFFDEVLGSWRSGHYFCCCCCGGRGGGGAGGGAGAGAGARGGGWWFSIPIKIQQTTFSTQLEGPFIAWRPLVSSKVGSELGTATVRKKKHIIWRLTFCYYKIWTAISSWKKHQKILPSFGMFWHVLGPWNFCISPVFSCGTRVPLNDGGRRPTDSTGCSVHRSLQVFTFNFLAIIPLGLADW